MKQWTFLPEVEFMLEIRLLREIAKETLDSIPISTQVAMVTVLEHMSTVLAMHLVDSVGQRYISRLHVRTIMVDVTSMRSVPTTLEVLLVHAVMVSQGMVPRVQRSKKQFLDGLLQAPAK
jgi:hypothetical protein